MSHNLLEIIEKLPASYSLPHWNNRERSVLVLNNECLHQGPVRPFFDILGYKENVRIQKTMKVSEDNYEKIQKYFASIF